MPAAEERQGDRRPNGGVAPDSALARLLAREADLEASIAETRRQAEEKLTAARERAGALLRHAETGLEEDLQALRESVREEHRGEVDEIRRSAAGRARRYRSVPDGAVDQLARDVLRRLAEETA